MVSFFVSTHSVRAMTAQMWMSYYVNNLEIQQLDTQETMDTDIFRPLSQFISKDSQSKIDETSDLELKTTQHIPGRHNSTYSGCGSHQM
ncbi:hypothetical protein C0J52_12243 [Blattella germanica]|nr:hypothetical protein C0J52_12243 [Blattella germanica]